MAVDACIVAVESTAGSALYGMIDVLAATGTLWQELVGGKPSNGRIEPRILSHRAEPFLCGNRIPVQPDCSVRDDPRPDIVILPELWLGPDEHLHGQFKQITDWVCRCYHAGSCIYSACSGAVLLAETGLLNGREATSHWGYERLFRSYYPEVRFKVEPALQFADAAGRIVTAGGTTSWHDLALHIIARHCSPGEAVRIAKVYLLKTHGEGQLPYACLVQSAPHADGSVRACEKLLAEIFREPGAVGRAVALSNLPERTLKRRFRAATGLSLMDYIQNLRIEEAKRLLEATSLPVEEVSAAAGYENSSFFRRLFRRRCGLPPSSYRQLFQGACPSANDPNPLDQRELLRIGCGP